MNRNFARYFACFTFDDGYRDNCGAAGDARICRALYLFCRAIAPKASAGAGGSRWKGRLQG